MREGWRWDLGEDGKPLRFSAKLWRWLIAWPDLWMLEDELVLCGGGEMLVSFKESLLCLGLMGIGSMAVTVSGRRGMVDGEDRDAN